MPPRGALGLYRIMLRLLPVDMRRRFGRDMEEVLALRLERAGASSVRRAWVWASAMADLVVQSVSIRFENRERGVWRMRAVLEDLGSSFRTLRSAPGFTLAAIATLALGIGASTATFSVVHAVLLDKLPVEEPDRLVFVWPEVNANKAMALRAAERMPSLESVSGLSVWTLTLTGAGEPQELRGLKVQPGYFDLLGVTPQLGRTFEPDADLPGQAGVVILSHDLWVRAFGSDPGVIDRVVDVGGADYDRRRVVGVMPPGVHELWEEVDVWIPLEADRSLGLAGDDTWYVNQRLARLAPGATLDQANAEVRSYAREIQEELPDFFSEEDVAAATVQPFRDYLTKDVRAAIWVALAAVGLVLLIGCFNVANLLLARGDSRARDLAVRAALGAGRTRLTRMLLAEAALIGLAGGAAGVAMAYGLVRLMARNAPPTLPGIGDVAVNGWVLGFALAATALSVVAAGLAPAIRVSRVQATATLGGASRSSSGRGSGRVTPVLVASQIALAVVVTVGSGLMLRSLSSLLAVDPGIDGQGVLALKPSPPPDRYPDGLAIMDFYDRLAQRVAALPEVSEVGGIHLIPGRTSNWSFPTHPEGYVRPEGSPTPSVNFRAVRGDYFGLTRIPVVSGRPLEATDRADAEPVVVVNRSFVQRFWPGEDPLGRTVRIFSQQGAAYRVVGVVEDVRQFGPAMDPAPEMYFSHAQVPWDGMPMWILARVRTGDPEALARAVQEAVWEIDPAVPVSATASLEEILDESTGTTRFLTWLLSSFGLLALLLCAVGVFGVTAYTSGRRKPEFGVRLALGSSRRLVVLAGISRSFGPVVAGLAVGMAGAASSASLLRS
ncbi:MAG: ABC transporter permease, partial [Longimicrobiales bacterium]|nr:ABC transporter permease [Longimicrobiales bacterium]